MEAERREVFTMKQLRTRLQPRLTAQEVATQLGVSVSSVFNWDNGRTEPTLKVRQMLKLCQLYQCSLETLAQACEGVGDEPN